MIGWTLTRYFALRFAEAVGVVFVGCFVLVAIVDFVELLRRAGDLPDIPTSTLALLSLCRVPALTEQILPFAVLFGAMASFIYLSRRMELVVARAAGISAWQFISPALIVATTIGVIAVTLYNPLSAALKEKALQIEAEVLGSNPKTNAQGFWIRQRSIDGQSIMHAQLSSERGTKLNGVTVYSFDATGRFIERIEALSAQLQSGAWVLRGAQIFQYGNMPQNYASYLLSTNLSLEQVRESFTSPDTVSFWQLPDFITATERAGLPAIRYHLQYQSLLARPVMLVAMVLIAAMVSLRFFRLGGMAKMILYGVGVGFLLYVVSELSEDLGAANLIPSSMAAWFPAVFGIAMGSLVLLHQEDG